MNSTNDTRKTPTYELPCPDCGAASVSTAFERDAFVYGTGPDAVTLTATVPVRRCDACGLRFTDREAEGARHEAVCAHLGIMTPTQIRDLRSLHGHSQSGFAELTRLGEATISRWERGVVVQNHAYDNYLYLLGFVENVQRLRQRASTLARGGAERPPARFKVLRLNEALLKRRDRFDLVPRT